MSYGACMRATAFFGRFYLDYNLLDSKGHETILAVGFGGSASP